MDKKLQDKKVYAFIDGNNLYLSVKSAGWKLDYKRFRVWLKDKYNVSTAYMFIGYVSSNKKLYDYLENAGYVLKFKPTIKARNGEIKGNIDADLVLQAMIDFFNYDYAVLVSNDGDFYSLVRYLRENKKLLRVVTTNIQFASFLLRKEAKGDIVSLGDIRTKIEMKQK